MAPPNSHAPPPPTTWPVTIAANPEPSNTNPDTTLPFTSQIAHWVQPAVELLRDLRAVEISTIEIARAPALTAAVALVLALFAAVRLRPVRTSANAVHRHDRTEPMLPPPVAMPTGRALEDTVGQLMHATNLVIGRLDAAPPLQGVLRQEVELIRQRLALTERSDGTPIEERQRQVRLKTAVRELYRLVKIAEGASESLAGEGIPASTLPQSREAALHLLGVNPDVSPAILKKVVDALRVSWHPDHARDEPDRIRREERTKQINVAWDLIREKPVEA